MEKNSVLIATFNRVHNYGACLQAYALQRILNLKLQVNAEHLDLQEVHEPVHGILKIKTMLRELFNRKANKAFDSFQNQYINYTEKKYRREELERLNKKYDYYIVGSDQVWNCKKGVDSVFFLEFVKDSKKISYAASMGMSKVPEEYIKQFITDIKQFDCISVRERSLVKYIEYLTGVKTLQVLDPVFLVEKEEWEKLMILPNHKKFILFFGFCVDNDAIRKVQELKKITGLPVWSIYKVPGVHIDRILYHSIGPREFLGYIHEAEYIVTSSFHCTAFSLIFGKKVLVFHHAITGGRTKELLELLNCESIGEVDDIEQWAKEGIYTMNRKEFEVIKRKSLNFLYDVFKERV